jgi:long-chain fatty acid transport protein
MYVDSESKSQVNRLLSDEDGGIKLEESGTGVGYVLSALYEPNSDLRLGVNYRSKVDVDMDGIPEFNGISDLLILELNKLGLLGNQINVDFEVPQIANAGVFYQINSRYSITADALWLDMPEFGVNHVSVSEVGISVPSMFEGMYGASLGLGYRLDEKTELSFGAFYMSSPVDKTEDRTLFLNLDRVISVGAGIVRKLDNGNTLDIKLDFADLGDAPISIENDPIRGNLKGQFDNNYAILLDLSYHFNW